MSSKTHLGGQRAHLDENFDPVDYLEDIYKLLKKRHC